MALPVMSSSATNNPSVSATGHQEVNAPIANPSGADGADPYPHVGHKPQ